MTIKPTLKLCALLLITLSLSGCQINKYATRVSEAPEIPAEQEINPEDKFPEYVPGAFHVNPAADLATNPAFFGKFKGTATRQLKSFYDLDDQKCHGFLEPKPALVFDEPGTSDAYKITANGEIDILFVEFSDREVLCQRRLEDGQDPAIELANSRGRAYKIYGGRFKKHAATDFALTFENLGQPLNVNWLDVKVPTLTIDSDLTPPKFLEIKTTGPQSGTRSPAHGNDTCSTTPGKFTYELVPEIRIEVKQPAVITLGVRSNDSVHMTLVGPIPDDRREIPTRCFATHTETLELEAGTYYIRLGFPKDAANVNENINFFVHGAAAALDPLTHFEKTPSNLPVSARALSLHYPFLNATLLLANDTLKYQLFTTVPPSLYVVATQDFSLDQAAPTASGEQLTNDKSTEARLASESLKKDELLLLINGENLVIAADGSMFVIPQEYLKPAEQADAILLPTTARSTKVALKSALILADESDQGIIEQYKQRQERYNQCVTKTVSNTNADDSDHVKKTCGYARLNDENLRFEGQLETSRTQRRNEALNNLRARLADLVLVK